MSSVDSLQGDALQQAVEVAVLKKGLDTEEMKGEAAVRLIEESGQAVAPTRVRPGGNPDLGNLIDVYI